jgi:hypothetical protein
VRQRGKEACKLKLTNKNYEYKDYSGLESGKLVVGPISAQTLVAAVFIKYADEMGSGTKIHILSFIKIGPAPLRLMRIDIQTGKWANKYLGLKPIYVRAKLTSFRS